MKKSKAQLRHSLSRTYFMRGFVAGLFACAAIYGYRTHDLMAAAGAVLATAFMIMAVIGETRDSNTTQT
jgi:hypothetical protein